MKPCCNVMVAIEFLLEYIALFDFITDIIVAIQLLFSPFTGWAILTINAMFAPLYVSTVQMIQFLLDRVLRRDKTKNNIMLVVIAWSSICPLFILFMFVMDQVFVINSTFFEVLAMVLGCCCSVRPLIECIEGSYELLFQMKKHEVSGFRRMRTITQLMFESLI